MQDERERKEEEQGEKEKERYIITKVNRTKVCMRDHVHICFVK